MTGQHWVAFYCSNNEAECFDSFARNPGNYSDFIQKWLDDEYQVVQCETLQSNNSTACGQYCMFFVLLRSYGFSYQDILSALTSDSTVNDKFVCRFINKFFKLSTTIKDKQFLPSKRLKNKQKQNPKNPIFDSQTVGLLASRIGNFRLNLKANQHFC